MSTPSIEEANTSSTGEQTRSLGGNEAEDFNCAATTLSTPITSEEVARQIRVATDPLTRQLEKLCDLVLELRRDTTLLQSKCLLHHVARGSTVTEFDQVLRRDFIPLLNIKTSKTAYNSD